MGLVLMRPIHLLFLCLNFSIENKRVFFIYTIHYILMTILLPDSSHLPHFPTPGLLSLSVKNTNKQVKIDKNKTKINREAHRKEAKRAPNTYTPRHTYKENLQKHTIFPFCTSIFCRQVTIVDQRFCSRVGAYLSPLTLYRVLLGLCTLDSRGEGSG